MRAHAVIAGFIAIAASMAPITCVAAGADSGNAPAIVMGVRIDALLAEMGTDAGQRMRTGLAALRRNDLAAAEREFRAAAQSAPDSAAPLLALADIAVRRGDHGEALLRIQQAVKLAPCA